MVEEATEACSSPSLYIEQLFQGSPLLDYLSLVGTQN